MKKLYYDIEPDGKVGTIGYDSNLPNQADGTEPWFQDWGEESQKWKKVNGTWEKWWDELDYIFPERTITQVISSPAGFPNITRTLHVGRLDINVWIDTIFFELFVRHTRPNGTPILEYDEIVKFKLNNTTEIRDPVTGQDRGLYSLFFLRMVRDGLDMEQVIKQVLQAADNKGLIDVLITKY